VADVAARLISETLRIMEQLDALFARIDELDECDDAYVRLVGWTVRSGDPERAQVDVLLGQDYTEDPGEPWRVLADKVVEWQCHAVWPAGFGTHYPEIHAADHPLLWTWSGEHGELYFRGPNENLARVAAELHERHQHETGGWLPISRFVNRGFTGRLRELLAGGYGSLASGPLRLLEAYADVLQGAGFATSLLRSAGRRESATEPLSVVTFGDPNERSDGHAYIVAAGFSCERVQ
jgi:hypothetical protein